MKAQKLCLFLVIWVLLMSAIIACANSPTAEKPYFSEDEVVAIVKNRLLTYKIDGQPILSVSISGVRYVGEHKWSGRYELTYQISETGWTLISTRQGVWTYYERTGILDLSN